MAVDVEHRYEHQHLALQRRVAPSQCLTQRDEAGVLAVDLACMDAALNQHHRQLQLLRGFGRERAARRHDQRQHRPSFGRRAEALAAHCLRELLRERIAQPDHFVVATGLAQARTLGQRRQRRRGIVGSRDGGSVHR